MLIWRKKSRHANFSNVMSIKVSEFLFCNRSMRQGDCLIRITL